jgi:hypothetical protein
MRKHSKSTLPKSTTDTVIVDVPHPPNKTGPTVVEVLAMQERLAASQREADELLGKLRIARGTRGGVGKPAELPLPERIDAALKEGPMPTDQLARVLGASPELTASAIEVLRGAGRATNIGSVAEPRWCRVPGDGASTAEINDHVRRILMDRPMTWLEIAAATGARQGRISGAIVRLQGNPALRVVNLGTRARARWFIVPAEVQVSTIKPR